MTMLIAMRTPAAVLGALALAGALLQSAGRGTDAPGAADAGGSPGASSQSAVPQARSRRGGADAGPSRTRAQGPVLLGTDPPGRLRPTPADAGVTAPQDAGPTTEQRELQQLRARVDALEQQRFQQQDQQARQLDEVVRQLRELRGQIADGEQRRKAAEDRQEQYRAEVYAGVNALYQAEAMLAGGNSAVDDQLAQAQAAFPPQAQREVQAARSALRNRDLSAARTLLYAAIADAQQGR